MTKIEVDIHEDVVSILNKLKNINDTGIELIVPEGAVLFENVLNLKLIKNWSDKAGKVINFQTDDVNGQNLILNLEEGEKSVEYEEFGDSPKAQEIPSAEAPGRKFSMPKISLKMPRVSVPGKKKGFIIGLILAGLIGGAGYLLLIKLSQMPKANVKIVVNSQPLIRSIEVDVKNGEQTDAGAKILKGTTIETTLEDKLTLKTTGEKQIGEKAKGSVIIYNKTTKEKKFKKGTTLIYTDDKDKEYGFLLDDDVEVPPQTDGSSPGTSVWGKSDEAEVIAKEIGKKYNLEEGQKLDISDQKSSEFEAEVSEEIKGGKEEDVKVVAQKDIDDLKAKLLENSEEKVLRALEATVGKNRKLINGTSMVTVTKEVLSNKLDDQVEEITLTQTFSAKGLVYEPVDLDRLVDQIVQGFVPEGYTLSTKERVVNVEALGNTEKTTASPSEADVQVTLRTYVVPEISEDVIKKDLYNKSVGDAQKYLGSIKNIKTYELSLSPRIPFFDNIPKDDTRISVTLERE